MASSRGSGSEPPPSGRVARARAHLRAWRAERAHKQDGSDPASRLKAADVLLLTLGLAAATSALVAVAAADGPVCTTTTTTETVFGGDPDQPRSGTRKMVEKCTPPGPTSGYPEAALIVAVVLVLPALSRRVAEGFEASALGAKVKKTSLSELAAQVPEAVDADEAQDTVAGLVLQASEQSSQNPG